MISAQLVAVGALRSLYRPVQPLILVNCVDEPRLLFKHKARSTDLGVVPARAILPTARTIFLAVMMPMPRRAWLAPAVPAATAPLRRRRASVGMVTCSPGAVRSRRELMRGRSARAAAALISAGVASDCGASACGPAAAHLRMDQAHARAARPRMCLCQRPRGCLNILSCSAESPARAPSAHARVFHAERHALFRGARGDRPAAAMTEASLSP